jgi:hypothetical protein
MFYTKFKHFEQSALNGCQACRLFLRVFHRQAKASKAPGHGTKYVVRGNNRTRDCRWEGTWVLELSLSVKRKTGSKRLCRSRTRINALSLNLCILRQQNLLRINILTIWLFPGCGWRSARKVMMPADRLGKENTPCA